MQILIVKLTSMGDVVHALPTVTDIHRCIPGATIDWVVETPFAAIPALHPGVRTVIPQSWRKWRGQLLNINTWHAMRGFRQQLQAQRYDCILDLQGLLKSACIGRLARGPLAGYDAASAREPWAASLYQSTKTVSKSMHAVERCRRLAAAHLGYDLSLEMERGPMDFGLPTPALAIEGWSPPATDYAVLIPSASRPEKRWPQPHWIEVAKHLQRQGLSSVVLWGNPAERHLAQSIANAAQQALEETVPPFLSVQQAAGVLARAKIVIGLDTGFAHLAAAFGRPTLGIYCDHEPALAGITGSNWTCSLGGKGQSPALEEVCRRIHSFLGASTF
jgi:heptosyltransferase-1